MSKKTVKMGQGVASGRTVTFNLNRETSDKLDLMAILAKSTPSEVLADLVDTAYKAAIEAEVSTLTLGRAVAA
jgi:hypothetical protein